MTDIRQLIVMIQRATDSQELMLQAKCILIAKNLYKLAIDITLTPHCIEKFKKSDEDRLLEFEVF